MKSVYTKILSVALVLSFVIPNTLFLYPKKAEGEGGGVACAAGYAIAAVSKIVASVSSIYSVPEESAGNNASNYQQESSSYSGSFNQCILKPLAQQMLLVLVRNIGASVVEWVNSGFEGKPLFVTDFQGFLLDTADGVVGNFIEGSELGWLCNDFSAQIRLSLALKYSKPTREKFRCTVSDIVDNTENFFENNGGKGWDSWLELTTQPQNNVYGAYFMAQDELSQRVANQVNDKTQEIQRNAGFLNYTYCEEMETAQEASNRYQTDRAYELEMMGMNNTAPIDSTGVPPQCKPGKTKTGTPGSVIASKLNSVINQSEVQLAVAQEIDQVIGAVLNQLAQKAISGAQGVLGLSKKKSSVTGSSYLDKYRQNLYGVSQPGSTIVIGATSDIEDYRLRDYQDAEALMNLDPGTHDILATTSRISNEVTNTQTEANKNIFENDVNMTERNSALLKPTTQSSSGVGSASNAVNGVREGNVTAYMPPSITGEEQSPWWQTDLGRTVLVKEVRIWRVTNKPVAQTLEQIEVIVYGENDAVVWQSPPILPRDLDSNPITVPVGISGSKVRIQKYGTLDYQCRETYSFAGEIEYEACYRPLELAEVEVMETVTPITGGFGTTTQPFPNPPSGSGTGGSSGGGQNGGVGVSIQNNPTVTSVSGLDYKSTVTSATSQSGLDVYTYLKSSTGADVAFSSVFDTLNLNHGRQNGSLSFVSLNMSASNLKMEKMSIQPNNGYRINLSGTKKAGVSGSYVWEVIVRDSAGNSITTQRTSFVVQ